MNITRTLWRLHGSLTLVAPRAAWIARTVAGRVHRRGEPLPNFPWRQAAQTEDSRGYRDEFLYVLWPLSLLWRAAPAWNRYVIRPLIEHGVMELEEAGYFHDARLRPIARWFRGTGVIP